MSIEHALVAEPRSAILAAAQRRLFVGELRKSCRPELAAFPVALEPPFSHMGLPAIENGDAASGCSDHAATIRSPELMRMRIWVSPEQSCKWHYSERFLKQLQRVRHRVSFELAGNKKNIELILTCHRHDLPILQSAFHGEFESCRLIEQSGSALRCVPIHLRSSIHFEDFWPPPPYSHLFTRPEELRSSPLASVITAMNCLPSHSVGLYQVLFQPVAPAHDWHSNVETLVNLEFRHKMLSGALPIQRAPMQEPGNDLRHMAMDTETKAHDDKPFFAAALRVAIVGAGTVGPELLRSLSAFSSLIQHGGRPFSVLTERDYAERLSCDQIVQMFQEGHAYHSGFLLNSWELCSLVHVPSPDLIQRRGLRVSMLEPLQPETPLDTGTPIGVREEADRETDVCIPPVSRMAHTHVLGATGTGKSTITVHMGLDDIARGHGIAVFDPHGQLIEDFVSRIPKQHLDRVIYFDPGDKNWVPLWNPLKGIAGQDNARIADDLIGAFRSFVTGWGHRLEHLLRHAMLAVLHLPNGTLLDVAHLLRKKSDESEELRRRVIPFLENPLAQAFWNRDFLGYGPADLSPPQHKLSRLLSSGNVAHMLSQPENRIDFRDIMDTGKILLIDLSKIGSETRDVLGCFMLSLFHQSALGRSDVPETARKPFHIYCDEAHRFVTDAIEDLISETRKYNVSLTLAHQNMSQFSTRKADAISNVGTTIMCRLNSVDATFLRKDLQGRVTVDMLNSLPNFEAIARIGTDVVKLKTRRLPPPAPDDVRSMIIEQSRRRYYQRLDILKQHQRNHECFTPLNASTSQASGTTTHESPKLYGYQEL